MYAHVIIFTILPVSNAFDTKTTHGDLYNAILHRVIAHFLPLPLRVHIIISYIHTAVRFLLEVTRSISDQRPQIDLGFSGGRRYSEIHTFSWYSDLYFLYLKFAFYDFYTEFEWTDVFKIIFNYN